MADQAEIYVDEVIKTTDRACLCNIDGDEVWIPWSLIDDGSDVYEEGDSGTIYVPVWFAEKEGLA